MYKYRIDAKSEKIGERIRSFYKTESEAHKDFVKAVSSLVTAGRSAGRATIVLIDRKGVVAQYSQNFDHIPIPQSIKEAIDRNWPQ